MARPSADLLNLRFSRWTVLKKDIEAPRGAGKQIRWICRCECGIIRSVSSFLLRKGGSKSCGCLAKEVATKHGMRQSKEYQSWVSMRARVKPSYPERYLYFDRGINIDPRWDKSFETFIEDMGLMPQGKHSIDRIDNDLGYCKHNCRWATDLQQGRNRRNVIRLTHGCKTQTIQEWAEEIGVTAGAIKHRYDRGWDTHKMLTTPLKNSTKSKP